MQPSVRVLAICIKRRLRYLARISRKGMIMNIIDFHVHAGVFDLLRDDIQELLTRRPFEPDIRISEVFSQPDKMESYLVRNGVVKAVVIAECGPGTEFTIDSEMIVRHCAGKDMFIPFGNINPNHHDTSDEFWKSLRLGVKGFKFYPADHSFDPLIEPMWEVYRLCAQLGLPIIFHTGLTAQRDTEQRFIHPFDFKPIAEAYPDLVLILAHGGKPLWHKEAMEMAINFPNVYIDTALLDPAGLAGAFPDLRVMRDKIVFGSDWPVVGSYSALMEKYREIDLADDLLQGIFHGNATKILSNALGRQQVTVPRILAERARRTSAVRN